MNLHKSVFFFGGACGHKGHWFLPVQNGIKWYTLYIRLNISSHELQKIVPEHAVVQCVHFKKHRDTLKYQVGRMKNA